jgi:hypothetical protein
MIRTLILSAAAASGLALTPNAADAAPPAVTAAGVHDDHRHGHRHRDRYEVVYRHGRHWDVYRTFNDRGDAERAARRLERRGYDARVRRADFGRR